jgi:hypothetical protein
VSVGRTRVRAERSPGHARQTPRLPTPVFARSPTARAVFRERGRAALATNLCGWGQATSASVVRVSLSAYDSSPGSSKPGARSDPSKPTSGRVVEGRRAGTMPGPRWSRGGLRLSAPVDADQAVAQRGDHSAVDEQVDAGDEGGVRAGKEVDCGGDVVGGAHPAWPSYLATHSTEQTLYFGEDGLIRRHDYDVEIMGGSGAAHYISDYNRVGGVMISTRHRIFPRQSDGQALSEPLLVSIELSEIALT